MTAPVPPGWHHDPGGGQLQRWWDGQQWTAHTRPHPAAGPSSAPGPHPQQGGAGWPQGNPGFQHGAASHPHPPTGYAAQGYPQPPGGGPPGGGPPGGGPPAKKHGLTALLVVVSALALFIVIAVVSPWGDDPDTSASTPTPSTPSATPTPSPTPEETFTIMDRPGYDAAVAHVDDLEAWFSTAYDDGTIYDYVPNTDDGRTYAAAVLQLLRELQAELNTPGEPTTDTDALDTRIQEIRDEAQQYSDAFENGQDLGVRVEVEWADGTTTTTDGTFPEGPDPDEYADAEEFAASYVAQPDGDGNYAPAAEEIAAAFDLELYYDHDAMFSACEYPDNYELLGGFCPSSPEYIYINDQYSDYPNVLYNEGFVHTVRHEIAHHQIVAICGTVAPPIAGESWEGVTNSYAVNYLGANPEWLFAENEYAMSGETEEAAQLIHDEQQCQ